MPKDPKLPILISLPHAGLCIPELVRKNCLLSLEQIKKDGDEGAEEVYAIKEHVMSFVTTKVARAILDMNRAPDDLGVDGVVKTRTIWGEPIYRKELDIETIGALIATYYEPYHQQLHAAAHPPVLMGIDCHTMAAFGPPIGPDTGQERPWVCLSDGEGACPPKMFDTLTKSFIKAFDKNVSQNMPFKGGYITRHHASPQIPWVQLELSRAPFMTNAEKKKRVLEALRDFYTNLKESTVSWFSI